MWQAFYIVFLQGLDVKILFFFFLMDDRGYRSAMLNCKKKFFPHACWNFDSMCLFVYIYKYMYIIVIGLFFYRNHESWESHINNLGLDFIYDWSIKSTFLLSRVYSYLWPVEVWTNLRICVEYEFCLKQYSKKFVELVLMYMYVTVYAQPNLLTVRLI